MIVEIVPGSSMPVDQEGNRADVIMNAGARWDRNIIGGFYEIYYGAAQRDFVKKHVCEPLGIPVGTRAYKAEKALRLLHPDQVEAIYSRYVHFLSCVSTVQAEEMALLSYRDKPEALASIIEKGIYIYYPMTNQLERVQTVRNLQKHYPPHYDRVWITKANGQKVLSKKKQRIGPGNVMLLEKIADDGSSVSSGNLQHLGFLSPITKSEKYAKPFRNSPVRTVGETEGRLYAGVCGREAIAEMLDRNGNPSVHRKAYRTILTSPTPSNIPVLINRDLMQFGGSKGLQLNNHMSLCSGWQAVYEPEPELAFVRKQTIPQ